MKSGFIRRVSPELQQFLAEPPRVEDALGLRHLQPEFEVVTVGFRR
jgi:hypothetical protein